VSTIRRSSSTPVTLSDLNLWQRPIEPALIGLPLLRRKIRTGFVALLLVGTSDAFGWWLDILMRGKRSFRFAWFGEGGRLSNAPGMNEKK
jgi:hypothetical protein